MAKWEMVHETMLTTFFCLFAVFSFLLLLSAMKMCFWSSNKGIKMKLSSNLFENFFLFFWGASYDINVHQTSFSFMNAIMKEWANYFRRRVGMSIKPNTLKASVKIYPFGGKPFFTSLFSNRKLLLLSVKRILSMTHWKENYQSASK